MNRDIIHFGAVAAIAAVTALFFLINLSSEKRAGQTAALGASQTASPGSSFSIGFRDLALPLGLALTAVADVFLILLGNDSDFWLYGVLIFCAVESVYCGYLKPSRRSIILRISLFTILTAAVLSYVSLLKENASLSFLLLIAAAVFDIVMLSGNTVDAFSAYKKEPSFSSGFFASGLALFFLCDISVGLKNITADNSSFFYSLIWIFYLPSQLLIMASYLASIHLYHPSCSSPISSRKSSKRD